MRRILFLGWLFLLHPALAGGAPPEPCPESGPVTAPCTVTVTVSPSAIAAIDQVLARPSAPRAPAGPGRPTSRAAFLQSVVDRSVAVYERLRGVKLQMEACGAFRALPPAERAAIVDRLGGQTPCP